MYNEDEKQTEKEYIESLKNEIVQIVRDEILKAFDSKKVEIESKIVELKKAVEGVMNEIIYIKNELKDLIPTEKIDRKDLIDRINRKEEIKDKNKIKKIEIKKENEEDIIICD